MSGGFTVGGLITGLDTNSIISQLIQLERQPILRVQDRISVLDRQKTAIQDLRTQLLSLRSRLHDFTFSSVAAEQYKAASSDESILKARLTGSNPAVGVYDINVLQRATATVATSNGAISGPIDPDVPLANSGIAKTVTAGTFTVNGAQFTIDPDTDSLNDILTRIDNSAVARLRANYDSGTDKVTLYSERWNEFIVLGASGDTSNFLDAVNLSGATQVIGPLGRTQVTSTTKLGGINMNTPLDQLSFAGGAITSGTFLVNGTSISIDPTTDTLQSVLNRVNASDALVSATYDATADGLRVISDRLGSPTISFEAGTSNFLDIVKLTTATQVSGSDALFTINGGAVETRNTNTVTDAITDVSFDLIAPGSSTLTVSVDQEAYEETALEDVKALVTEYNSSLDKIQELIGSGGVLAGDSSIRVIDTFLRSNVFNRVEGLGDFVSLADIGITTGSAFDSKAIQYLELDEDKFLDALRDDPENVQGLFSNAGNTGIADQLFNYIDEVTKSSGFLNDRIKTNGSFDNQIRSLNDQIDRMEERVTRKEEMLRRQFSMLEQLTANYQSQGSALSALSSGFSSL